MDTYENDEMISAPVPEEEEQPMQEPVEEEMQQPVDEQAEEETPESFYHSVGTGTKEETYTVPTKPVCDEQLSQAPQPTQVPEKKQRRSLFTRVMCVVAVFAVVLEMIAAG